MWNLLAAYPALYISAGFILGLLFGSFLNVVIIRLPRRLMFLWEQQCQEYLTSENQTTNDQSKDTALQESEDSLKQAPDSSTALNSSNITAEAQQATLAEADHSEHSSQALATNPQVSTDATSPDNGSDQSTTATEELSPTEPPGIVFEPSHCVECKNPISAWENIPVISYVVLRGRCRHCGTGISLRYPIVELITAVLSAIVLWQLGPSWAGLGALLMTWSLVALTGIDIDHQLLPDNITLPLLWLGLILNVGEVFTSLDSAVIGAAAGYLSLWLVFQGFRLLTGKEGMGFGDFKLTAALGAWFGWQMLPVIIFTASVTGTIVGVAMMLSGRQQRGQPIPFGPYLAMGGWVAMLWGPELLDRYLGSF